MCVCVCVLCVYTVCNRKYECSITEAAHVAARAVVGEAEIALNAANVVLEATKQVYKLGAKAAELIADYGIDGLISICYVRFNTELSR